MRRYAQGLPLQTVGLHGVCDPSTGTCDNSVNMDDGTSCENGDVCDGKDTCQDGTCENTGKALKCDDGDVCTADACDAKDGCSNTLVDGARRAQGGGLR